MQINIEKRHLFLISALVIFLAGTILVFAANPTTKPNPGHYSNETMVNIGGVDKTLQAAIDAGDFREVTITYTDCRWVNIYARDCAGVPGCSISGSRVNLDMPAPWVVVGGNWNSPDYTDTIKVCKINIS